MERLRAVFSDLGGDRGVGARKKVSHLFLLTSKATELRRMKKQALELEKTKTECPGEIGRWVLY